VAHVEVVPALGAYLTDGARLYYVLGFVDGKLKLEDCLTLEDESVLVKEVCSQMTLVRPLVAA
jgi:hypothetical protein